MLRFIYSGISNYGFSIKNQSNSEIITNVSVYSDCVIKITCSEDARGLVLNYAKNSGHHSGRQDAIVGVGGLSDSMDSIVSFTYNNIDYNIENLAPIFGLEI